MTTIVRLPALTALGLILLSATGCSMLPSAGPDHSRIQSDAAIRVRAASVADTAPYALVDISSAILPYFDQTQNLSLHDGLKAANGPAPQAMLGTGDVVTVTVFESQAGGLFIPADGSRPGNFVTFPAQSVDASGNITVPYAGVVRVADRPIAAAQTEIEDRLSNRAIEPQVIISATDSKSNRLSVLGDVNQPAELDINPSGERLLDIISRAGGLKGPAVESYVTVRRGSRSATQLLATIATDARENIFVRPGDTIYVHRDRRTFLVFGASGLNGRIDFDESNLTLGEAMAKSGGLLDNRADPSQVFLYRAVPRATLDKAGIDTSRFAGDEVPVIFQADMRDPAMLFAMQQFRMQDKDVLYVANAGSVTLSKFLSMVNGISDTSAAVPANLVKTRDSVEALVN
jgi:polysaccharide export outer membrane protein